jgi:hypothetical protein
MEITDSIVEVRRQGMLSDPNRKIMIEESGIKIVSGIKVGYLKYTFRVNNKFGRSYGIDLFFCNGHAPGSKRRAPGCDLFFRT